jgi:hypothetical protein
MKNMSNYRDAAPTFYKDLTSKGILSYFEDERTTEEELTWIQGILSDSEYQSPCNPISKWNWGKIKTAFAIKFFPDIAPVLTEKTLTVKERVMNLLSR